MFSPVKSTFVSAGFARVMVKANQKRFSSHEVPGGAKFKFKGMLAQEHANLPPNVANERFCEL